MGAVFLLGQLFLFPTPPATPPLEQVPPASKSPQAPDTKAETPKPPAAVPPMVPAAPRQRPAQRLAVVETPLYRAVISSEGGKIQELVLKYRGDKPLVMVGDLGPKGLLVGRPGAPAEPVPMTLSAETVKVTSDQPKQELVLSGEVDGVRIRQTLVFHADTYMIDARLRAENATAAPQAITMSLPWETRQVWHEAKERFLGQYPTEIAWLTGGYVARAQDLCAVDAVSVDGQWISAGSIAYIAALIPRTPGFKLVARAEDKKVCETPRKEPAGRATIAVEATPTIPPGQAWEGEVTVYTGPKEYDRLKAAGLEGSIDFGGFPVPRAWGGLPMEWLGVPILLVMNWLYGYVHNYGVAIILLTVVSKALFYPLTVKSMRSMKAMQSLQPQINTLRSKYKSDPQRLQRETLELYRQHKVNPVGGCLPMLAQIPIFYALYIALTVSVELQNASFLCFGRMFGVDLWICDLAAQDPTYILPLLMGVTMFIQQKMTPIAGDPRQAKLMLMMPVVFTFMFLNLASGLVLYWTVSNILQIAQQYY
ncbi:MAG TPA: membrane protein insertase YidC, partial [Ramlibacter sp.]|nr:membrane protein insertase YidC [Ramlibacter sp.]